MGPFNLLYSEDGWSSQSWGDDIIRTCRFPRPSMAVTPNLFNLNFSYLVYESPTGGVADVSLREPMETEYEK